MVHHAPLSPDKLNFHQAWMYCLMLEHRGHKDWRMPRHDDHCSKNGTWVDYNAECSPDMDQPWYVVPVRDI